MATLQAGFFQVFMPGVAGRRSYTKGRLSSWQRQPFMLCNEKSISVLKAAGDKAGKTFDCVRLIASVSDDRYGSTL